MWNGGCLNLNSYLEKLLEGIFLSKFLFITMKKHIEGLLEMLLCLELHMSEFLKFPSVKNLGSWNIRFYFTFEQNIIDL